MADEEYPDDIRGRGRKKDSRNLEMFKLWLSGKKKIDIAKEFGIHKDRVYQISVSDKWHEKKQKVIDELYSKSLKEFKNMIYHVTESLKDDLLNRIKLQRRKKNKLLTIEEQKHFVALLDKLIKETRLEAGKPTDLISGEVVHKLIVPEGVKRLGIMPPNPNVKIEAETKSQKEDIEVEAKEIKDIVEDEDS